MRTALIFVVLIALASCKAQCIRATTVDGAINLSEEDCNDLVDCIGMCTMSILTCRSKVGSSASCEDCWTKTDGLYPANQAPYIGAQCYSECYKEFPVEEVALKYFRDLNNFCNTCDVEGGLPEACATSAGHIAAVSGIVALVLTVVAMIL